MSNGFALSHCCRFQEGYVNPTQKEPKYFGNDVKWLRASDLNDGYVFNTERLLSDAGYKSAGKSAKMFEKDTLAISKSGTIGSLGILKDRMCGNRAVINIAVNSDLSDLMYVFYTLKHKKSELIGKAGGSIQKNLYISALETLTLNHQQLQDQKKIAAVLSALDAKIDCNNRINAELEAMASMFYDYWFVQFDFPDVNGKPYKSSGGKMVYNHVLKREIPAQWNVEPLLQSCEVIDCLHSKTPQRSFEDQGSYLLQLENILDNGQVDVSNKYFVSRDDYETWTSRIEVKKHDIVMTNAGRVAAFAQIPTNVVCGIGRNITAIRPKAIHPNFFYLSLSSPDVQKQIFSNLDQGAFFKSFNVKGIKALNLLRPNSCTEKLFEATVTPLIERQHVASNENQQLTQLRDWLLPMLMNGQVTVS